MTCVNCLGEDLLGWVVVDKLSVPGSATENTEYSISFDLYYSGIGTFTVYYCIVDSNVPKTIFESSYIELSESNPTYHASHKITMGSKSQILEISIFDQFDRCQDFKSRTIVSDPADEVYVCGKSNIADGNVTITDKDDVTVLTVKGTTKDCTTSVASKSPFYAFWDDVTGYITPKYQKKSVNAGETADFYGEYIPESTDYGTICAINNIPEGNVTVYDSSDNVVLTSSGTSFNCNYEAPLDTYTAKWDDVTGYNTPKDQTKTLSKAGDSISFNGIYTTGDTGKICASTNLNIGAVTVYDSNDNAILYAIGTNRECIDLEVGIYYAEYLDVKGFITPEKEIKELKKGETLEFYGIYTTIKGEIDYFTYLLIIIAVVAFLLLLSYQ